MANEQVLVAGFSHETNTFVNRQTTRNEFQRHEYFDDEVRRLEGTNTALGGAMGVAERKSVELIHPVAAAATPSGVVAAEAYEFYTTRILDAASDNAFDGVFLALHGAMVQEGDVDGEGPLIMDLREQVGPDVPIVATYDLHGNISEAMIDTADATIAYESYPHVDMGPTGERGMCMLVDAMRGRVEPTTVMERIPLLPYGPLQNTREGPMAEVMATARELEARDKVLKVNVFPGFHQADVPDMGFSVSVVVDDAPDVGQSIARELAEQIWEMRDSFVADFPSPADGIARALDAVSDGTATSGPVVVADLGDNPGGGSAADGTTVLRELLDQGARNVGFAIIRDPETVRCCVDAGVGNRVEVTLGGKTDDRHGEPIEELDGYVASITDGEFRNTGPMGTGTENHLGTAVRLQCGADDGIAVLLTENRMQPYDAEIWRHMGIQPERFDILVVKSTNHYRADYEPLSSQVIPIDSPGLVAVNPARFNYQHINRPLYPIDEGAEEVFSKR